MVKVCHVTSVHNRYDVRIFHKECKSLAKNGYDVTFLVNDELEDEIVDDVKIISTKEVYPARIERLIKGVRNIIKKALEVDADIYHLHDPELLLIAKKLKKNGKKVIFDSHEYYYNQIKTKSYIPKVLRNIIASVYKLEEDRACKYIDAAIFPCPIYNMHPFEDRVKICEFIDNTPIIDDELRGKGKKEKKEAVCCVGSLTKERGIEVLIDACYLAKVPLVLAGNYSPNEFKSYLENKKSYSIVDYRGVCNREEVQQIYDETLIGASNILRVGQYPFANNLPTKVYEYMMNSMPFIISDFEYFKKVVDKYKCGILVDPSNVQEIAKSIKWIISNKEEAIKMGKKGYDLVESELNWKREENKLCKLYKKL